VTVVFELAGFVAGGGLSQLDGPFSLVFLPVGTDDLGVERHILAQIKDLAHFIEILAYVSRIGE